MAGGDFAKIVVRGGGANDMVNRASDVMFEASEELLRRAASSTSAPTTVKTAAAAAAAAATQSVSHRAGSGLTPLEIILTLAVLLGVFIFLLFVGMMCKLFNKPTKEAAPYVQQKLYQPSAAGYGTRAAMQKGEARKPLKGQTGSRMSLLAGAGPMGYDGRGADDTSFDTSQGTIMTASSQGAGHDYFGRKPQAGHTRGQSSGVQLPGASMVSSRKGAAAGAHPTLDGFGIAPDGGGFTPGKPVTHAGYAGPAPSVPKGPGGAPAPIPSHARVGLGRPPAADANRRSRYSRAVSRRIDSVGPGQIRKSLYLGQDDDPMNSELYSQRRSRMMRKPSTEGREEDGVATSLRRVDSMGRGDSRRKSQAVKSSYRASRATSVYNAKGNGGEKAILLSAQADNFGSGRGDPLGARNPNTSAYLSPNGGAMYATSQDARSRSGSSSSSSGPRSGNGGSSPMHSPGELPSPMGGPLPSHGRQIPTRQASNYSNASAAPTGNSYFSAAASSPRQANFALSSPNQPSFPTSSSPAPYPTGGAPRIRPGQPYQPYPQQSYAQTHSQVPMQAVGGYERAARQIV